MKYVDEYRDGKLARKIAATIAAEAKPDHDYRFMEFCGGHTHAIARYGLEDLLPKNVRMIHGPGCPVCVLPVGRMDDAIKLAQRPDVTLCTYADLMRVPGSNGLSLIKAKAAGADIRMVYSTLDALAHRAGGAAAKSRVLRHRLRDHHAADRARYRAGAKAGSQKFLRVLQSRPHPGGDPEHFGEPRCARPRPRPHRRVHRPGACLHRDRHAPLRFFRRRIPKTRGGRRLRAARRDAGHSDAGAAGQRRPLRGRERIQPRGDAGRQSQGARLGQQHFRTARHVRMAWPRRRPVFGAQTA